MGACVAKEQKANNNRIRVVTYLPRDLLEKISEESEKMGIDESVFIRHFLTVGLLNHSA